MRRVTFVQDLRGTLTEIGPGLVDATLAACDGDEATLVSQQVSDREIALSFLAERGT